MQTSELKYKYLGTIRSAAILTGSDVATDTIGTNDLLYTNNQIILICNFTIGSLTTVDLKIEFSNDKTTWYQETTDSVGAISSGVITITEGLTTRSLAKTGIYRIAIPINDKYVRVLCKGIGTATDSSLAIHAIIGTN